MIEVTNPQIVKLHRDGLTVREIAQALSMDETAVGTIIAALGSFNNRDLACREKHDSYKQRALEVMAELMEDSEDDSVRLRAAESIYFEKGNNVPLNGSDLNEKFKQVEDRLKELYNRRSIPIESEPVEKEAFVAEKQE